jgi:hypothetical protein
LIQLIFFFAVGAGLLALLFVLARRAPAPEGSAQALVEAQRALETLQSGLLPPELVQRIFAKDDLNFVGANAPRSIREVFLRDRKQIALAWSNRLRNQVLRLKDYHFRRSRFYSQLSFATEISLAISFAALLLQCRMLQLLLLVGGPYAAPNIVGRTVAAATRICEVSEKSLAFLSPARVQAFGEDSPKDGATVL